LHAGAIFIREAIEINIYLAVIILLAITGIYTITGGLKAVMYTDTVQTIILLGGATAMCILSFNSIGGYSNFEEQYMKAVPSVLPNATGNLCGLPRDDAFHIFRNAANADIPWPGILGIFLNSLWYWCTDQIIVQRTLASKNLFNAKLGCIFAGFCKITPMYFMVMIGMIARIELTDTVACATPESCLAECGAESGCSNYAYPRLVSRVMPTGAKGLMLACMLCALMSSLTSIFNSAATLFSCDLWRKIRKQYYKVEPTEKEQVLAGRIFIVFMIGVSIAWIPVVSNSNNGQLFDYIQEISSYLTPPIGAVVVMCIFVPSTNEPGAFWSLLICCAIGVVNMVRAFIWPRPGCDVGYGTFVFNYLYYAVCVFLLTMLMCYAISKVAASSVDARDLAGLTWWTRASLPQSSYQKLTEDESNELLQALSETKWQKIVANMCAVVTIAVCVFLFVFYG